MCGQCFIFEKEMFDILSYNDYFCSLAYLTFLLSGLYSRCRKLLQATIRANRTGYFLWVGSDSWGAKVHPVRDQEYTAEGAITILPYRNVLEGKLFVTLV